MKRPGPLAGWLALLPLLSILNASLSTVHGQGTAFTYQGWLSDGTNLANGTYDLRFYLFELSVGGHPIAGPLTNTATVVSNGHFAATLDFGPRVFTGGDCWLSIGVRTNGGSSFTILTPRQQVTPTPYAILASGVGAGAITANMLADGAVTTDKIAAGAVKTYQVDDDGNAAYEQFKRSAQAAGENDPLPFAQLRVVPATNGVTPALVLYVDGAVFGTVVGFSGSEGMSKPYYYVVEAQYSGSAIDPEAQLGLPARLVFTRNSRTTSYKGVVTGFTVSTATGSSRLCTVRIEAPLASLERSTDYRIHQEAKAPEVAANLYKDVTGLSPTLNLQSTYRLHENLVQYAETGLNFFSRLLEHEGIFYFFNPGPTPPGIVLGDSPTAYAATPNSPFIYYGDTATNVPAAGEYIRTFQRAGHQSTRTSIVNSYNFQTPSTSMVGSFSASVGEGAQYEFGNSSLDRAYNLSLARLRQERQAVEHAVVAGSGTAPDLRAGHTFTLEDSTGAGLGGHYVVTEVRHAGFVRITNGISTLYYGNQFQVIPAELPYRPALQSPRPLAQPCTAVVTGAQDEEIWTDAYGRVKVQFHWDRYGTTDETSSGWIRQASPMASGSFRGMLFLPRIGDEVLVSFLMGDPHQPVITGSLYNSINMPPYPLPARQTVSTIRSTGSKGRPEQVNEIQFDDLAGKQELRLQAAKDLIANSDYNMEFTAGNQMKITAASDMKIEAGGHLVISVASNLTVQANTQTTFTGPLAASSLAVQTGSSSNLTLTGSLYLPNSSGAAGAIYSGGTRLLESPAGGIIRLGTPGVHNTTHLAGTIQVTGNVFMNDQDIQLRDDGLHGLGWYGSPKGFGGVNVNGPVVYGNGGGALGAISGSTNIALIWDHASNVGIRGLLVLSSNVFLNDKNLYLRGDLNHGVGWFGNIKPFGSAMLDGPVVYGYSGGGLGTQQTGTATNLAVYWNAAGNVGIGTTTPNQRLTVAGNIYATGTITPNSDRDQKTDFAAVDPEAVLAKVADLPIQQWRFKSENESVKHVGPMAQDFQAAFGLGETPTAIATIDADGVALAAIQGLNQKLERARAENAALKARLEKLEQLLNVSPEPAK